MFLLFFWRVENDTEIARKGDYCDFLKSRLITPNIASNGIEMYNKINVRYFIPAAIETDQSHCGMFAEYAYWREENPSGSQ